MQLDSNQVWQMTCYSILGSIVLKNISFGQLETSTFIEMYSKWILFFTHLLYPQISLQSSPFVIAPIVLPHVWQMPVFTVFALVCVSPVRLCVPFYALVSVCLFCLTFTYCLQQICYVYFSRSAFVCVTVFLLFTTVGTEIHFTAMFCVYWRKCFCFVCVG